MDIASIFIIVFVAASSLWAGRHVDAWGKEKWMVTWVYTAISVAVLFAVGLLNKRLYLFVLVLYLVLFFNLEASIKSRYGHIWYSIFVGISGIFPMAIYQLFFQ